MKTTFTFRKSFPHFVFTVLAVFLVVFGTIGKGYGQTTKVFVKSINSQNNVDDANNVLVGQGSATENTFATVKSSTLLVNFSGHLEQDFQETIPAGTATYVRIGLDDPKILSALLGGSLGNLLDDVLGVILGNHSFEIQVKSSNGTPVLSGNSSNSFSSANGRIKLVQNSVGQFFLVITPDQDYSRIRITDITTGIIGSSHIDVYGAYYITGEDPCAAAFGTSYDGTGLTTDLLGGVLTGKAGVNNPQYAIDADLANYSEISLGAAGVGASMFQTVYFSSLSTVNDYFKVTLQVSNPAVLNVDLIGSIEVRAYNGEELVFSKKLQGGLINGLDVLGILQSGNKATIPFGPGKQFDRVAIGINSTATVLGSPIRLFSVERYGPDCPDPNPITVTPTSPMLSHKNCAEASVVSFDHVNFPYNTIDGNNDTYATLEASSGIAADIGAYSGHIELGFGAPVPADSTVYVRIDFDENQLGSLLDGTVGDLVGGVVDNVLLGKHYFTVEAKSGSTSVLTRSSNTGFSDTDPNAVGTGKVKVVQDKNGHYYVAITSPTAFSSVRITETLSSLVGAGTVEHMNVYHACYSTGSEPCEQAFATYSGSNGISLDLLGLGQAGVTDAQHAIDGDVNTASKISIGAAGLGASVYQYVDFHGLSADADHFRVKLKMDGGATLSAEVLGSIVVKAFNGDQEVFSQQLRDGLISNLELLSLLKNGEIISLPFGPGKAFDRVAVGIESLLSANAITNPLQVFSIERFSAACPDPELQDPAETTPPFTQKDCGTSVTAWEHVNFPLNTVDGKNDTYATLSAGTGTALGLGAYSSFIELAYTGEIPEYETSYIRIDMEEDMLNTLVGGTLGDALGDLLGGVALGNHYFEVEVKDATGNQIYTTSSVNAFDGHENDVKVVKDANGRFYIAVSAAVPYKSIRITHHLAALIGGNNTATMNVYSMCRETVFDPCEQATFTSFDGTGIALDLLDISKGGVFNPEFAIDNNSSNYSTINLGLVGVGASVYQNIYFKSKSLLADSLRLRVQLNEAGILNADIAGSYHIKLFNGEALVYDKPLQEALINNLDLLGLLNSGGVQQLTIAPGVIYDRVQFGLQSAVAINTSAPIRFYGVSRISAGCPDPDVIPPPYKSPVCADMIVDASNADDLQNLFDDNFNSYATIRSDAGVTKYSGHVEFGYAAPVPAGTTSYVRIDAESGLLDALLAGSVGKLLTDILNNVVLGDHYFRVIVKDANGNPVVSGSSEDAFTGSSSGMDPNNQIRIVQDKEGRYYLAITPSTDYKSVRIEDHTDALLLGQDNSINVYGMCYETDFTGCAEAFTTSFDGSGLTAGLTGIGNYGVQNPSRVLDNNNNGDYSEISLGTLSVAGAIQQNVQFNKEVEANSVFKIKMAVGTGTLDADVFARIQIVGYNNGQEVYVQPLDNAVIGNVNLLQLFNNGATPEISVSPNVAVDELAIRLTSLVGVSLVPNVRLYYIQQDCDAVQSFVSWKSYSLPDNETSATGGEEATYTIHIRNTGTAPISNFRITDAIPEHTTYVAGSGGDLVGDSVVFENINVAVGATETVGFKVTVDENLTGVTEIRNVALVKQNAGDPGTETFPPSGTDPNEPDPSGPTGTIIPVTPTDSIVTWKGYTVNGSTDSTAVRGGENITYTIYIRNTSNQDLADLSVSDAIPQGTTYVSGGTSDGTNVTFSGIDVAFGATTSVSFTVKVATDLSTVTEISNVALVKTTPSDPGTSTVPPADPSNPPAGPDPGATPGTPTVIPVTPIHDIELSLTGVSGGSNSGQAVSGDIITYTITVTNTGNKALTNVQLTDEVPANTTLEDTGDLTANGTTLTATIPTLAVGETKTFTFTTKVNAIDPATVTEIEDTVTATYRNEDDTADKTETASVSLPTDCTPKTAADITLTGPTTAACAGTEITLTATVTGITDGSLIKWYDNEQLTGTPVTGTEIQVSPTVNTTYYVRVEGGGFCFDGAPQEIAVTVNPMPEVPTITVNGPTTVCEGEGVELTIAGTPTEPYTYTWYNNGAEVYSGTETSYMATVSGTYTVMATSAAGCTSPVSAAFDVVISLRPAQPTITASGPTAICSGSEVILTSSASVGNQWFKDGAPLTGTAATQQSITVSEAGVYTVIVTDATSTCASLPAADVTVTVGDAPEITLNGSAVYTIAAGNSVTLPTVTVSTGATYIWYDDQGNDQGQATQTRVFATPGIYTYTVVATNAGGCSASATVLITVTGTDDCPPAVERLWANTQIPHDAILGLGHVENPANAVDGKPTTHSTLVSGLNALGLAPVKQDLIFAGAQTPGTPVTIKLGKDFTGLGVASGIYVIGLDANGNETGIVQGVQGGLLDVLGGDNSAEFTFVPADNAGPIAYKGVRVIQSAVLSAGQNTQIFGAYITKVANGTLCTPVADGVDPNVLDVLSGVKDIGAGVIQSSSSVEDPWNAVDKNNLTTYATIHRELSVANEAYLTTIFKTQSLPSDQIRIVTAVPQSPLLELELIKGYKIQRYLGDVPVGPALDETSQALSLKLLGLIGTDSRKVSVIVAPTTEPYDRVTISYGNVAGVLGNTTNVYDVSIFPTIDVVGYDGNQDFELCADDAITINKTDNCTTYKIFTSETGTEELTSADGLSFDLPDGLVEGQEYTFYIQAYREGCEVGARVPITVKIKASAPATAIGAVTVNGQDPASTFCLEVTDEVVLAATLSGNPAITNAVFYWYDVDGNPVTDGVSGTSNAQLNLGHLAPGDYTYYVGVSGDDFCETLPANRKEVTFTINNQAIDNDIVISDVTACFGSPVILVPMAKDGITGATFKWYRNADKTDEISSGTGTLDGASYTLDASTGALEITGLTVNTTPYTYYVVMTADGYCESAVGKAVSITVSSSLEAPVFDANDLVVCEGEDAIFVLQGDQPSYTYHFFDLSGAEITDANIIRYENGHIIVANVTAAATYEVGVADAGGCVSATRTAITVGAKPYATAADVTVTGAADVCAGTDAVFTPASALSNPTFRWYSDVNKTNEITTGVDANGVLTVTGLAAGTHTFYVSVSNADHCENQAGDLAVATINVNEAVLAPQTIENVAISKGQSIVLTASLGNGQTGNAADYEIVWVDNGTEHVGASYTVSPEQTTTYQVFVRSTTGAMCVSDVKDVVVTVENVVNGDCLEANAQTSGVQGICLLCGIEDAGNAVDGNVDSYATMHRTVNVLGTVWQDLIFPNGGKAGDTVTVLLSGNNSILDAAVLTALSITTYNGTTDNQDGSNTGAILDVTLFPGSTTVSQFRFVAGADFDRVHIAQFDAVGLLANGLRIHGANITLPVPTDIQPLDGTAYCQGEEITLSATAAPNTQLRWFDSEGHVIGDGESVTTTAPSNKTGELIYEVVAFRTNNGEDCFGDRIPVKIVVNATPVAADITVTGNEQPICADIPVVLTPSSTKGTVFKWYKDANRTQAIADGQMEGGVTYEINGAGVLTVNGLAAGMHTYYVSVTTAEGCENQAGALKAVAVTITPRATVGDIADIEVNGSVPTAPICLAPNEDVVLTAALTATSTIANPVFHWYDASGAVVAGGANGTLNLGHLAAGTYTYSVGVSGDNFCENDVADRKSVTFTVNYQIKAADIELPTVLSQCANTPVVITASIANGVTVTNPVFTWYLDAQGQQPISNGTVGGVTYAVNGAELTVTGLADGADLHYYVQLSGDNVCANTGDLATVNVKVADALEAPQLVNADVQVCNGESTMLEIASPQSNLIYRWYTEAATGSPVNEGETYELTNITANATYYVEAVNADGSCKSDTRTEVKVTVRPYATAADVTVTGAADVCAGTDAVFTPASSLTAPTFRWYSDINKTNEITTGVDVNGVLTVSGLAAGTHTYYVSVSNADHCENQAGDLAVATININEAVLAPQTIENVAISKGQSIVLTASLGDGQTGNAADYQIVWVDNGTEHVGASYTVNPEQTTTYQVFVRSTQGAMCVSDVKDVVVKVENVVNGDCLEANAQTNGTGGLLCIGCYIENAGNAVNTDQTDYAVMHRLVNVGGSLWQDLIFPNGGKAGDTISVVIGGNNSILDAAILTGLSIHSYQGSTSNNDGPQAGAILDVTLFPGSTDANVLKFVAGADFDRVRIEQFDLVGLLANGVRIYGANMILPAPTDIQPVDGTAYCQGEEITLSATAAANTQLRWFDSEGNVIGDGASVTTTAPTDKTGELIYEVVAFRTNNGVDCFGDRIPVKVVVNATPVAADITVTGNEQPICADVPVVLTPSSTKGTIFKWYKDANRTQAIVDGQAEGAVTYAINGAGVLTVNGLAAGVHTYYVSITTAAGCENQAGALKAVAVTITPRATVGDIADIEVNGSVPTAPICLAPTEDVVLTAALTATSTIANPIFHWYDASGAVVAGGANGTLNLGHLAAGTYTYSVGVSGDGVCESAASDRKSVTFTIDPTATVGDIADIKVNGADPNTPICLAPTEDVVLTAALTATSTITNPVFHWYDASGAVVAGGENGTLNLGHLAAGTYTYSVGVSGDGVCESAASDRKSVTFTINPTATVGDIADIMVNGSVPTAPICLAPNEDVVLTAALTATSTIANPVFHWYDASGAVVAGGANGTLNLGHLAAGTYTYSVGVSGDGVCESAAADRKSVTFTINPIATVDDIADIKVNGADPNTPICLAPNEDVVLTAALTATSTIANPVFHWYDASGAVVAGGENGELNLGHLAAGTYTYRVGVSGDGVCESAASDRKSVTFTINPTATVGDIADIEVNGSVPTAPICLAPNEDVVLTAALTATSTITNPVFHWYDASGAVVAGGENGELNLGHLAAGTYTYSVGVSGDGVCESAAADRKSVTFTINPTATVGDIADIEVNGSVPTAPICLAPNEDVVLTAALTATSTITNPVFHWYDASGAVVTGGENGELNLGHLAAGTYTYSVGVSGDGVCESAAADRKSVTFTINPTATVDDIAEVLVNGMDPGTSICIEPTDETILTAKLSDNSTITDPIFHWYKEDGTPVAGGEDGTLNLGVLAPGTYIYSVGVSGDGVCETAAADRKIVTFTTKYCSTALTITKKADQARVVAGTNTSFTVTITNNGPAEIAVGKVITLGERPSAGLSITGYEVTSGNGTIAGSGNSAKVTTTKAIAVSGTIVVKVTAKVATDAPATISNGIDVWRPDKPTDEDPDDKDDTPEIPVDYISNLTITKVADQEKVMAGESTTFTITVTNNGPSDILTGKVITLAELPSTGLSITGYEVTSGNATVEGNGNSALVTTSTKVAVGSTVTLKITAMVADDAPETISNKIQVWQPNKPTDDDPDDEDETPEIPVEYQVPEAMDDEAETTSGTAVDIPVLANDVETKWPLDPASVTIVAEPQNGSVVVNADGTVTYTSDKGYVGTDRFTYTVKDTKGRVSNVANVMVHVTPNPLFIPNVFTPNGDGKNDVFEIVGIEGYERVEIYVFNRWGNEVYSNPNYNNNWDGQNLNEGTYYYMIKLIKDNKVETRKGWVLLKRQ